MDKLWAPWRIKYIKNKRQKKCIFCSSLENKKNSQLIFSTKFSMCMLNSFPYNNGHLMISPRRHISDIDNLSEDEAIDLFKSLKTAKKLLDKVLSPQGYNIGINLGRLAGAGITGHLHIHIVPRWSGDTNFMPVLSSTKIISQSLEELSELLKNANKK